MFCLEVHPGVVKDLQLSTIAYFVIMRTSVKIKAFLCIFDDFFKTMLAIPTFSMINERS